MIEQEFLKDFPTDREQGDWAIVALVSPAVFLVYRLDVSKFPRGREGSSFNALPIYQQQRGGHFLGTQSKHGNGYVVTATGFFTV